jgi:class 3 adenylate cyclase
LGDLGDGALSSFQSAIDAVSCARAFQAATGTDPRFRIRVGIHVGDVLLADNTVLGDGVNIASRIQALAPPGGICISERVYEEIRNSGEWIFLKMERIFDSLRSEPRFIALMKKVNFQK